MLPVAGRAAVTVTILETSVTDVYGALIALGAFAALQRWHSKLTVVWVMAAAGIVGVILLYAMWLYHLLLFRGQGLMAWIGLIVVMQNFSTSLFNSHLFDFHEGWMYVLGVGVSGGTVLGARLRETRAVPEGVKP